MKSGKLLTEKFSAVIKIPVDCVVHLTNNFNLKFLCGINIPYHLHNSKNAYVNRIESVTKL